MSLAGRAEPLPDFLIIGAQKAGTTTLHRDLIGHPEVFLPQDKEPFTLTRFGDDIAAVERDYASLFRPAGAGQMKGEASTSYTMRPIYEGVAERALLTCGPHLKLIYLQRDPVSRLVSQYRHEFGIGEIEGTLEDNVVRDPRFVDFSSYAFQLAPWKKAFSADQLLVLSFEEYVRDRGATLAKVASFLGIDPALMPEPDTDRAFNPSSGKPVARGAIRKLVESRLYQRRIKPLVPWHLRDRAMKALLPPARKSSAALDPAIEAELRQRIATRDASTERVNLECSGD